MLKQRVITALILLPVIFMLLFSVQLDFFAALVIVIVYLMALEWAKLIGINKPLGKTLFSVLVSTINLIIWHFNQLLSFWPSISWPYHFQNDLPLLFLFASLLIIFLAVIIIFSFSRNNQWWQHRPMKEIFGLILLPSFFVAFVSIRSVGYASGDFFYGGSLLLFMLLLIWAADTGAYFTGKLFGRHKLTKVSPNKTWEGAIGGGLLSIFVGWCGVFVLNLNVNNMMLYLFIILLLAIVSVFGDLFESALKRVANIKDSGNLLPGHGGLLDRLDSTITVAPLFFLSFSYFEWFNA